MALAGFPFAERIRQEKTCASGAPPMWRPGGTVLHRWRQRLAAGFSFGVLASVTFTADHALSTVLYSVLLAP